MTIFITNRRSKPYVYMNTYTLHKQAVTEYLPTVRNGISRAEGSLSDAPRSFSATLRLTEPRVGRALRRFLSGPFSPRDQPFP